MAFLVAAGHWRLAARPQPMPDIAVAIVAALCGGHLLAPRRGCGPLARGRVDAWPLSSDLR